MVHNSQSSTPPTPLKREFPVSPPGHECRNDLTEGAGRDAGNRTLSKARRSYNPAIQCSCRSSCIPPSKYCRGRCFRESSAVIYAKATGRVAPTHPATHPAYCSPSSGSSPAGSSVASARRTGAAGGQRGHCLLAHSSDAARGTVAPGAALAAIQPSRGSRNCYTPGRRHSLDHHRHRSLCACGRCDHHRTGGAGNHRGRKQGVCRDRDSIPGASTGEDSGAGGPAPGVVPRFHFRFRCIGAGENGQPHPEQHRPICHSAGHTHCGVPVSLPSKCCSRRREAADSLADTRRPGGDGQTCRCDHHRLHPGPVGRGDHGRRVCLAAVLGCRYQAGVAPGGACRRIGTGARCGDHAVPSAHGHRSGAYRLPAVAPGCGVLPTGSSNWFK